MFLLLISMLKNVYSIDVRSLIEVIPLENELSERWYSFTLVAIIINVVRLFV